MRQETINKALEIIHAKKRKAEQEYKNLLAPLYENETFVNLERQHTKLMIENARLSANGEVPDFAKEADLLQKIELTKQTHGIKQNKPNYECKECDDTGYIHGTICKCLKKELSNFLLKNSGFEKLETFVDSIKTSAELSPIYKKMQEWCNSNFNKNIIYLSGPTGVGKTHLIRCMANELIERGIIIKISTAFKMNQDFKEFSKTHNEEILNKYLDCEVLFIDDLGTEPLYKNVTIEFLYLIINERKMKKLPTIITSNLDLYDLNNRYDERIFSRIVDRQTSITLLLNGSDRRLQK